MGSELKKKLSYKGGPALVVHAPEGYQLGVEESSIQHEAVSDTYAFIQLFVSNAEEARVRTPKMLDSLAEDGVFWITYPKQSSGIKTDINRDILAAMVQSETAYRVVSNVSIDATWSALRLRKKDKVKPRA